LGLELPTKLVAMATSLEGSENCSNFRSFIQSHSSTNPANLVRIGVVDVKITGLPESLKIFGKINMKQR